MTKTAAFLAAVATAAFAGTAQAQICAGYPTGDRGMYFGARADFPQDLDSYGVEANYNFSGPLGVYGGLNVISAEEEVEGEDDESIDELYAGVAFEMANVGLMIGPRVSACLVGEIRNMSEDGVSYNEIPIGLGIGASLGVPGIPVSGYVQPQLVISRISIEDVDSETETNFGVKAGATIGFGLISVGGEVRHLFIDEDALVLRDETTFGIRVGVRF
ncbi:MAG: outer membrane beta-barrel protein [Gemmatimonadetes bacterium]|nr:outer membrane beta-barrel protein [Gemmatimonadota bacterium]